MVEYGYIDENGIMLSKILEPHNEHYKDGNEELKERVVTIGEQAEALASIGWKPVDLIDETRLRTDEYYSIELLPYDTGERIRYQYNRIPDIKAINRKIDGLTRRLSSDRSPIGDYRITKCHEASLSGKELPYDVDALHSERQKVRDEINRLRGLAETMGTRD